MPGKPCRGTLQLPVHKFGILRYPYFSTPTHMEYAGKVTQENAMKVKLYYMQYGWWKALWLSFCVKPIFPYFKGMYFN